MADGLGAVVGRLDVGKTASELFCQAIQISFDAESLQQVPVEMAPEVIGGEAAQLLQDLRVHEILVAHTAVLALGIGTERLADLGAKGEDRVKTVGFLKNP